MNINTIQGIHIVSNFIKLDEPIINGNREFIYQGKIDDYTIIYDKFGHCPNNTRSDVYVDLNNININEIPSGKCSVMENQYQFI
jgi:monomeric isocitrate dehydrogenase